jgi:hypothetical protein
VKYTPETSVIKFLSNNSSTKTGLWQAEGFLAFLKKKQGLKFGRKIHALDSKNETKHGYEGE